MSAKEYIESINDRVENFMQGMDEMVFSFETSLGEVTCRAKLVDTDIIYYSKLYKVKDVDFEILKGDEYITDLYDGFVGIHAREGWIKISLMDEYYGSPEYKITLL